jgi:hypothetical protein
MADEEKHPIEAKESSSTPVSSTPYGTLRTLYPSPLKKKEFILRLCSIQTTK